MIMLDDNKELYTDDFDREYKVRDGVMHTLHDDTETWLRETHITRFETIRYYKGFHQQYLNVTGAGHFERLFIMEPNRGETTLIKDYPLGAELSGFGDATFSRQGIDCAATYYADMSITPTSKITSSQNFAFGCYIQETGTPGTIEMGANDGTNHMSIQLADGGGLATAKVGTVTLTYTNPTPGHLFVTVIDGAITFYQDGVSMDTDTMAGSLPAYSLYLGAVNSSGTDANNSDKKISCGWVYDGQINAEAVNSLIYQNQVINDREYI